MGARLAIKFCFDFSSHVRSSLIFSESFAFVMNVEFVAISIHLIKAVLNNIGTVLRMIHFFIGLDGYFEHSVCLESTDGVDGHVFTLILIIVFRFIIWVRLSRFFLSTEIRWGTRKVFVHRILWRGISLE